jgi:hypothetical protein
VLLEFKRNEIAKVKAVIVAAELSNPLQELMVHNGYIYHTQNIKK